VTAEQRKAHLKMLAELPSRIHMQYESPNHGNRLDEELKQKIDALVAKGGMTLEHIAEIVGVAPSTVGRRRARIREQETA
jgi:transposase-like protein